MGVKGMLVACFIMLDWSMLMIGTRSVRSSASSGTTWAPSRAPSLTRGGRARVSKDHGGVHAGVYDMGGVLYDMETDASDTVFARIQRSSGIYSSSSSSRSTVIDDGNDSPDGAGPGHRRDSGRGGRGGEDVPVDIARGVETSRSRAWDSKRKDKKCSSARRARSRDVERLAQPQIWENMFCELALYKQYHGDCNVKSTPATKLGRWVGWQRGACRHEGEEGQQQRSVKAERASRLEALGIEWESRDVAWESRLKELLHFRLRFGDSNVPRRWGENRKLGSWVSWVRQRQKVGKLPRVYLDRLQGAALQWSLWDPKQGRLDEWEIRRMSVRRSGGDQGAAQCSLESRHRQSGGGFCEDTRQYCSLSDASLLTRGTHAAAGADVEQRGVGVGFRVEQRSVEGSSVLGGRFERASVDRQYAMRYPWRVREHQGEEMASEGVSVGHLRGGGVVGMEGRKRGDDRAVGSSELVKGVEKQRRKHGRVAGETGGGLACAGERDGGGGEEGGSAREIRVVENGGEIRVVEDGGGGAVSRGEDLSVEPRVGEEEDGVVEGGRKKEENTMEEEEGEEEGEEKGGGGQRGHGEERNMGGEVEEVYEHPEAGREDRGRMHVNMAAALQLAENGEMLGLEAGQYWWEGRATMICNMSVRYAKPPNRLAAAKIEEGMRQARLRLGADPEFVTLVRAWGLWHLQRFTRGDFSNLTLVSNHSKKISPTVSVCGGPWEFQRCGVKAESGTAMLVFEEGHAIVLGCSLGGVHAGEALDGQSEGCQAAFGMTVTDSGRIEAQGCLYALCAGPGVRFTRLARGHVLDSTFVGCGWEGDGAGAVVEGCTRK